jgi:predicted kinase
MKVIVCRGISGSGKSSYISKNYPNATVCSADHFFMHDGEYKFNPSNLNLAHRTCMRKFVLHCTDSNYNCDTLVVDNTNLTLAEIAPYIQVALAMGHEVEIIRLSCPAAEAAQRNKHGVPFGTVEAMLRRFENLPAYWPKEKTIQTGSK